MSGWTDIIGYEGVYQISRSGDVKSLRRFVFKKTVRQRYKSKKIKPCLAKNGYLVVNLSKKGVVKQKYIHRLLAQHFIKNPDDKPAINHKNGNKTDNRLENLEWVTHGENHVHALKNGLKKMPSGEGHCCYGKTRFEIFGN